MNRLSHRFQPSENILAAIDGESKESNVRLEEYLARLSRRLTGVMPDEERESLVEEVRSHLEQSVRAKIESGKPPSQATEETLAEYGSAKQTSEEFLTSWFQCRSRTPLTRIFGRANLIAYGWLQLMEALYLFLLEFNIFLPSEPMYRLPWKLTPAQVRQMWPEPLPFPDFTPGFFLVVGFPFVAPILAGWVIGRTVPVGAASAVYRALMPLILVSFVMGALLLPSTTGLLFALFQVSFWLPVGCLTAHFSSLLTRRTNRKVHDRAKNPAHSSPLGEATCNI